MSRIISLKENEYEIIYPEPTVGRDYDIVIKILDVNKIKDVANMNASIFAIVAYSYGVVDTTIKSSDYECLLIYQDNNRAYYPVAIFNRRAETVLSNTDPSLPTKERQVFDPKVGKEYRGIQSRDGTKAVYVSDAVVEITAGKTKLGISESSIIIDGPVIEYNMPSKSQGGLFKETGILRLLPKCFLPPFAIPDYLPDVVFMGRVANTMKIIKDALKVL